MKKCILIACLFLTSCFSKRDETCLNGYLIGSFDLKVNVFCEGRVISREGIVGYDCSNIPFASYRAVGDIRLTDGVVFETECYNRLHE